MQLCQEFWVTPVRFFGDFLKWRFDVKDILEGNGRIKHELGTHWKDFTTK